MRYRVSDCLASLDSIADVGAAQPLVLWDMAGSSMRADLLGAPNRHATLTETCPPLASAERGRIRPLAITATQLNSRSNRARSPAST